MTIIKRAILFYIIGLVLLFFVSLLFGEHVRAIFTDRAFWILPAVFSGLGLLIGIGINGIVKNRSNKKNNIFVVTHSLTLILMVALALAGESKDQYQRNHANIDGNHDVMKYFVNDDEQYIRIGFKRLEAEFKNPNDFHLYAFSVRKRDTIINGIQDTIYNIYFAYFLKNDKINKYFSKVSVVDEKPTLSLYNLDTKTNDEYSVIKAEKDKSEKKAAETIKEAFRQMPDSTKNIIKKALFE